MSDKMNFSQQLLISLDYDEFAKDGEIGYQMKQSQKLSPVQSMIKDNLYLIYVKKILCTSWNYTIKHCLSSILMMMPQVLLHQKPLLSACFFYYKEGYQIPLRKRSFTKYPILEIEN